MKQLSVSLEEAIEEANKRILPDGYKPEDYFCVGEEYPLRIAKMIIKETLHIIYMNDMMQQIYRKILKGH